MPNISLVFEELMLFTLTNTFTLRALHTWRQIPGCRKQSSAIRQKKTNTKYMWFKTNQAHDNLSMQSCGKEKEIVCYSKFSLCYD